MNRLDSEFVHGAGTREEMYPPSESPFLVRPPDTPTILVTKKKSDPIRPSHYQSGNGDVIDFCNKYNLDFTRGSAVKYICRAGKKDPSTEVQDLEKAIECLRRAIEFCKAKEAGN